MKKIKQKITKVTRLPGNAVVMSLMAVILLCGAPAVIAMIDKDASYDIDNPLEYDEDIVSSTFSYRLYDSSSVISGNSATIFYPSDTNDGTYLFDTGLSNENVWYQQIGIGGWIKTVDVQKIVLNIDGVYRVDYRHYLDEGANDLRFAMTEESPGVWVLDLTSVQRMMIKNSETSGMFEIRYNEGTFPADGIIEFSLEFYESPITLNYSTILLGATGVLLIVCALLATPWFGLSGYTGYRPKIKRRR